jgi:hypothetical protein
MFVRCQMPARHLNVVVDVAAFYVGVLVGVPTSGDG